MENKIEQIVERFDKIAYPFISSEIIGGKQVLENLTKWLRKEFQMFKNDVLNEDRNRINDFLTEYLQEQVGDELSDKHKNDITNIIYETDL